MVKVVMHYDVPASIMEKLSSKHTEFQFIICLDKNKMMDQLSDAEVLVTQNCSIDMLKAAPNLKWIQVVSAGVDLLPLGEIKSRGIILTNAKGVHKTQMSEYAIASMIMLARNFHMMLRNQFEGKWDRSVPQSEICGKTVGILGLGSIGHEVARKASLLGMRVIGMKNHPEAVEYVDAVYGQDEMGEIFRQSDYVINLLPGTRDTEGLIDKNYLNLMKSSACFINMGRGKSVNEDDLVQALKSGKIRAFASDVFEVEPLPKDSPLWNLDNVILTPHICGESPLYAERIMDIFDKNLEAYLKCRKNMINIVDPDRGY